LYTYCTWCMNLRKFGLNRNTYLEMLDLQGGVCAICGGAQQARATKFAVDHDHLCCPNQSSCGKCVRGLLCNACNAALGMMSDDPKKLRAAAAYLERR
jgi:Recombination endonuclease VII